MNFWQTATILTGGIATLAIFSFLIKENRLYRFFEHLFIGISAGFGLVYGVKNFLYPKIIVPLLGLDIMQFPDGSYSKEYDYFYLLYLISTLFGLLYYFIYSKKHSWLAKLVIGFSLGSAGGLAFQAFFNRIMPQIYSSFKPLVVFENQVINYTESLNNIVFVFTLLAVLYYFFFSFRKDGGLSFGLDKSGRFLMMICFGAFFGSTIMARMALLVERLQFLISDWFPLIGGLIGI